MVHGVAVSAESSSDKISNFTRAKDVLPNINHMQAADITPGCNDDVA